MTMVNINNFKEMNSSELAVLGEGNIAYVKPMRSEEIARVFPQVQELEPGLQLFALLSASGQPILLTDTAAAAVANAWEHELQTVSLH